MPTECLGHRTDISADFSCWLILNAVVAESYLAFSAKILARDKNARPKTEKNVRWQTGDLVIPFLKLKLSRRPHNYSPEDTDNTR